MSDPIDIDTSEAMDALDQVETRGKAVYVRTTALIRRGWDSIVQFAALTGQAIDQSYQLMAQGLFVAAETLIAIATAEIATGALAFKAALSFGLAVSLTGRGLEVLVQGENARLEANNIIGLSTIWRLY